MPRLAGAPLPADQGHTSPGGGATPVRDRRARRGLRGTDAAGHTRRPRYTWGKRGTVVGYHFATVLPERSARGEHGAGEHFYTVEFDGRELWGDDAEPGTAVRIDLFESYLEATS